MIIFNIINLDFKSLNMAYLLVNLQDKKIWIFYNFYKKINFKN